MLLIICTVATKTDNTAWVWGYSSGGRSGLNDKTVTFITNSITLLGR